MNSCESCNCSGCSGPITDGRRPVRFARRAKPDAPLGFSVGKRKAVSRWRRGFSLLELLVTAAIMAVLVTSVAFVLRSSQTAWIVTDSDRAQLESAYSTVRHITRYVRQAEAITAITDSSQTSGSLTLQLPDGSSHAWSHSGDTVSYGSPTPTSVLAVGITELTFQGYLADSTTPATQPADVQLVHLTIHVQTTQQSGGDHVLTAWMWVRSW
jgi:prepilin-type N-terminal cleavage/methylation domain-containing protein